MEARKEKAEAARRGDALRQILPIVGLIAIFLLFNLLTDWGMVKNLSIVFSSVYPLFIASVGVFFIMTMGGLDFSQGSILGLSSIVIAALSSKSIPLAIVCGVLTGALVGALNGFFHVKRKIPSFIVTICTMFFLRGVIKFLTTNSPVNASAALVMMDTLPLKVGVTLAVVLLGFVAFRFTKFGPQIRAIGAGERAAWFAGVSTDRVKFFVYVLAGAITGLAALISLVKVGSVTSSGGNQFETQILIALVLGGMPISGGSQARFRNVVIGCLIFSILNAGLTMLGLATQTMQLIEGAVFLAFVAVFADRNAASVVK